MTSTKSAAVLFTAVVVGCGPSARERREQRREREQATIAAAKSATIAATTSAVASVASASATAVSPVPEVIRPDILTGAATAPALIADGRERQYRFPAAANIPMDIGLRTDPGSVTLNVRVLGMSSETHREVSLHDGPVLAPATITVTAPETTTVRVIVTAASPIPARVSLSVKPQRRPFDDTTFEVFVHFAGDEFGGIGGTDEQVAKALIAQTNVALKGLGVAIDEREVGCRRIKTADARAVNANLIENGRTVISSEGASASEWGRLGIDASDPKWGKALDVVIVQSPPRNDASLLGIAPSGLDLVPSGVFVGNGPGRAIVLTAFDASGRPSDLASLAHTLAHEIGHFLTLRHTTERLGLIPDDLGDTPFSTDRDGDGLLDPAKDACPDVTNVMFPLAVSNVKQDVWTLEQQHAVKGWLALVEH